MADALAEAAHRFMCLGLLDEAADAFRALFRARRDTTGLRQGLHHGLFHGLLLLIDGDVAAYRELCTRLLASYAENPSGANTHGLVRLATLHPETLADWGPVAAIAEAYALAGDPAGLARHNAGVLDGLRDDTPSEAASDPCRAFILGDWPGGVPPRAFARCEREAARWPKSGMAYVLAALHLRDGRPEECLRRIEAADKAGLDTLSERPLFDLLAATAHQRLGRPAEARRLYDRGVAWAGSRNLDQYYYNFSADPVWFFEPAVHEALRREAEAVVVYDPTFPADPFAR